MVCYRYGRHRKHGHGKNHWSHKSPNSPNNDVEAIASPANNANQASKDAQAPIPAQATATQPAASPPTQADVVDPLPKAAPVAQAGLSSDQQALLNHHNEERAKSNAAPLSWDTGLASAAQDWYVRVLGC